MPTPRTIYKAKHKLGELTQGSIINGCIAECFPGEEVYGCIITRRCAMGHKGKTDTVHYLPMVPFKRWFEVMGKPAIKQQWKKNLRNTIDTKFKNAKAGEKIMDIDLQVADLKALCDKHIKKEKEKQELNNLLDQYFDIDTKAFDEYIKQGQGLVHEHLKALIGNQNAAYYLIESWDKNDANSHYVIILDDIRHLQFDVAMKIKDGVEQSDLPAGIFKANDLYQSNVRDGIYWVEAEIVSPFIEHIVECFAHNFVKIGVEDIASDTEDVLIKTIAEL